jgi:hypothetical protein
MDTSGTGLGAGGRENGKAAGAFGMVFFKKYT